MPRINNNMTPKALGQARKFEDLRLMAKRANQAMVRLERLHIYSPAYEYAQASLATMGKYASSENRGARFNESGIATYNEYEYLKRIINKFLEAKTRTQTGAKQWVQNVWEGGNKAYDLESHGISKEDWLNFWKDMPANQKDRSLGSEVIVNLVRAYSMKIEDDKSKAKSQKKRQLIDQNRLSVEEIAKRISDSRDVKSAYKSLGLTYSDYRKSVKLGKNTDDNE